MPLVASQCFWHRAGVTATRLQWEQLAPAEICMGRGHAFFLSRDIFDRKLEGVQGEMLVLSWKLWTGASRG